MKVAVLVAGMYREFETAHKFWNFLSLTEVDVYFSTWDTTHSSNKTLGVNINEKVDIGRIEKIVKPIRHCIEPSSLGIPGLDVVNMFRRWTRAITLLKFSGIKYDAVILIRPDLFAEVDPLAYLDLLRNIKHGVFYIPNGVNPYMNFFDVHTDGVSDQMMMATQETMYKLLELSNVRDNTHNIFDVHDWLHKWLAARGTIERFDPVIYHCLIRPNSRTKNCTDFDCFRMAEGEWWDTQDVRIN